VDGHDPDAVRAAIQAALADDRPSLIACRTVIGYGAPNKAGTAAVHGAPLGADEVAAARTELGWSAEPFVVPDPILSAWRTIGQRGHSAREAWENRLANASAEVRDAFARGQAGRLPDLDSALASHKAKLAAERPSVASRKSSQDVLEVLTSLVDDMIGGSADLTGSNNTKTKVLEPITPDNPAGRYMYYGVREHGMVAAMNGIALHRGLIPYGGTFLVFTDYCRPSIRLASLMGIRVILVMTHDSIGLGEDGPTHQPVEHLASLRAMPNLWVMRPADAIEVAECWALALGRDDGPALLALSRQNLPTVRLDAAENLSAKGAYVLAEASGPRQLTLLATGSEVQIALQARATLEEDGVATAVVSMPCWELFEQQEPAYRSAVLGSAPRIAVEAAAPFGWTRYVASENDVVGMTTFGASGPLDAVYEHFGITPDGVVARARAHL
jgi:transketolase